MSARQERANLIVVEQVLGLIESLLVLYVHVHEGLDAQVDRVIGR